MSYRACLLNVCIIRTDTIIAMNNLLAVVLDEATSSLSEQDEACLYSNLCHLKITVLTIGHRSTLLKVLSIIIAMD